MRVKPLIAIPLIAIALAGCAAQQPAPEQSSITDEQKPLFSSDEEALAAAQAAYANYLEVSDQIARDGGANPERLKELVSSDLFKDEQAGFAELENLGMFAVGTSAFDSVHIQGTDSNSVSTYLCIDHSQIRLHDQNGNDVTSLERVDRYPLVVKFMLNQSDKLTISSSETWSGQNFC